MKKQNSLYHLYFHNIKPIYIIVFSVLLICIKSHAQTGCLSGNCNDGKGLYVTNDGANYNGEFKNNEFDGFGIIKWANGSTYEGEWKNGKRNGKGTYKSSNKLVHVGLWKDNKRDGQGTSTYSDGSTYVGEWKDDKRNGIGSNTWITGYILEGTYKDGYLIDGKQTSPNGDNYVGKFKDGKKNGPGILTKSTGEIYSGEWENDHFNSITNSQDANSKNNSTVIQNNSIINSGSSDCKDKIIKSKDHPSYNEYISFKFNKDDVAKEICTNSNNSLTEYLNKNGQTVGYCIYYFSPTGKRIKDETFDSKGRLMKQSLYEYTPNDKAKFMFVLNYLGEITNLRVVKTDGMRDVNFESPYPTSKEKAIYRYNSPNKIKFTDMCQVCKGTGYGNNNLKRCYICNGAGSITHEIIKY